MAKFIANVYMHKVLYNNPNRETFRKSIEGVEGKELLLALYDDPNVNLRQEILHMKEKEIINLLFSESEMNFAVEEKHKND